MVRYAELSTELPSEPPTYEEEAERDSLELQQLEEELAELEEVPLAQRLRASFHQKTMTVRLHVLDPLAEGYAHILQLAESQLSRVGNPLIVKRFAYVIMVALVIWLIALLGLMPQDNSRGEGSFSQRGLLLDFAKEAVDLRSMEETLEYFSSMEHTAGTAGDLTLARYVHKYFKEKGAKVVEFMESESLLNFPEKIALTVDGEQWYLNHQFNAFSKSGTVEGALIYVNHGRRTDYLKLEEAGVQFKDAICMVKYGDIAPSEKMLIAEHMGCAGLLLTSETDAFPDSAERRSVGITQFYPGDPLSPGWSAGVSAQRIELHDAPMPKLPSAALTWSQASRLWTKLDKGYTFDFASGDGSFHVKLENRMVYKEDHAIWNVLGKIPGKEQDDKAMIIGAARDAPCKGAVNPDTGTVVMLEVLNVLNKLRVKFNWEPLRSIYFISWDATQYNFAGAVELIERDPTEIRRESSVYLDLSDAIAGDNLEITTTALLTSVLQQYQEEYKFEYTQWDEYKNSLPFMAQGIPVMDIGYRGASYPQYTCDDTFDKFKELNIDPGFEKHRRLVELIVKISLNLIEDPLIPFDMVSYAKELEQNLKALEQYGHTVQPGNSYNFEALKKAINQVKDLGHNMANWGRAWGEIVNDDGGLEPSLLTVHRWNWNNRLNTLEKYFLAQDGLPGREWYKNVLFGPQLFKPENDDRWWSFPGIRDAIYFGTEVQEQIDKVSSLLVEGCHHFVQA